MKVHFNKTRLEKLLMKYAHKSWVRYIDCLATMFWSHQSWYYNKNKGYMSYKQYLMLEEVMGDEVKSCVVHVREIWLPERQQDEMRRHRTFKATVTCDSVYRWD